MVNMLRSKKKAVDGQSVTSSVDSKKPGVFSRLRDRLKRTRSGLTEGLANVILGKKSIDEDLLEELETQLLVADVGVDATSQIVDDLTQLVARDVLRAPDALFGALREHLLGLLQPCSVPLLVDAQKRPFIILVAGVNGVGKTTTIGKLAHRLQDDGHSVLLAAGDTFRAAAVEQLQAWSERNAIPIVAQQMGADSASVIFDAIHAARSRDIDVVIADTAGRLHTKTNLMEELKKVRRVIQKTDPSAPHETMLVIDAGTGQNALSQTQQFHEAIGLSGIALTKLDGTAKGGIIFAVAKRFGVPIRFIGVGEGIEDLRVFDAEEFIEALLPR
jgi:fused signal recognition particle receptor